MEKLNENIITLYSKWKEGYVRKETAFEEKIKPMMEWAKEAFEENDFNKMDFDPDGITVNGNLSITSSELTGEIPYPFAECTGEFTIYPTTHIKSLKNCPRYVKKFDCSVCDLIKSLEGAPEKVNGYFDCKKCSSLLSLEGAPEEVGYFRCNECNNLPSLKGAPKKVNNDFECRWCKNLKSLKGAPEEVGGNFRCNGCRFIQNLKGAPENVGGDFDCTNCFYLASLEGAPKEVGGDFKCYDCDFLSSIEYLPKEIGGDLHIDKKFEGKIPDDVIVKGEIIYE